MGHARPAHTRKTPFPEKKEETLRARKRHSAEKGDGLKAQKRIAQGKRSGTLRNTPAPRICALKRQKHKSARRLRGTPKPPLRCEAPPMPRPALFRMVTFRMVTLHYNPPACGATRKRKSKETEAASESERRGKQKRCPRSVALRGHREKGWRLPTLPLPQYHRRCRA